MLTSLLDQLKKEDPFKIPHRAVVVDNKDPDKLGRVKLFVKGIYEDKDPEKLPWVYPQQAAGLGGRHDSSSFAVPEIDSEVTIEFKNGDIYSPFIGGRWHNKQSNQQKLFDEDYPNSYGHQDSTGTFLRINKEQKYAEFKHCSGFYCKIDKDGNLDIHVPGTVTWNIEKDMHFKCEGDVNQEYHANLNQKIEKEKNVKIAENYNVHVEGDDARKVEGNQEWLMTADQIHKVEGDICIGAEGTMYHEASLIHHNLGTTCSPKNIEEASQGPGAAAEGYAAETPAQKLHSVGAAASGFMDDLMDLTEDMFSSFVNGMLDSALAGLGNYVNKLFAKAFGPDLEDLMKSLQSRVKLVKEIEELAGKAKEKLQEEIKDSDSEEA